MTLHVLPVGDVRPGDRLVSLPVGGHAAVYISPPVVSIEPAPDGDGVRAYLSDDESAYRAAWAEGTSVLIDRADLDALLVDKRIAALEERSEHPLWHVQAPSDLGSLAAAIAELDRADALLLEATAWLGIGTASVGPASAIRRYVVAKFGEKWRERLGLEARGGI